MFQGSTGYLTCTVRRANPMNLVYAWSLEGSIIPGESSSNLTVPSFSAADEGNYTCLVTNEAGVGMDSVLFKLGS